jgi:hypothetical protein
MEVDEKLTWNPKWQLMDNVLWSNGKYDWFKIIIIII